MKIKKTVNAVTSKLRLWLDDGVNFDINAGEDDNITMPGEGEEIEPPHRELVIRELRHPALMHRIYTVLAALCACCFAAVLIYSVAEMPRYGEDADHMDTVTYEYINHGLEATGAVNIIAGIILEYRAFDTLGESFVLFCALTCVLALLRVDTDSELADENNIGDDINDYYDLTRDPILSRTARIIIPVIVIYGIYVLLNGHLSPGGGFSGGAVLGAAVILISAAYGDEVSGRIISEKTFKTVTLIALSFYCLGKSYSFYTGANGIKSIISNGTPGNILSAGLILPLNIAVGMVVACTMYGIYRMFKRRRF